MLIRHATVADLTNLVNLVHLKAEFDGCPEAVTATPAKLAATLFCPQPMAYILLVEAENAPSPVGFASYHFTYSTFLAQPSIWLDDLFVQQAYRNQAIGTQLMRSLGKIAQQHSCGRIDWTVDVDNAAGIRFYQRIGGVLQTQVHLCRLNQAAIEQVAIEAMS
ncbi:MAG: GNAT family N-acetyltransferase [Cyanobacteria bacterium J06560_2]